MTAARGRVFWQRLALIWAVLGLIDAAYLSFEHLTASTTLACSENGIVNCAKVTTSSYSVVFGVPVAFLGLGYFLVMAALCVPAAYRSRHPVLGPMRLVGAVAGVVMVIYLVWAELFRARRDLPVVHRCPHPYLPVIRGGPLRGEPPTS